MSLNFDLMSGTMWVGSTLTTPGSRKEFQCYAYGIIEGLKKASIVATTTGLAGAPGTGTMIGIIGGGSAILLGFLLANLVTALTADGATPQPLQIPYCTGISYAALHIQGFAEIELAKTDSVGVGVGNVLPGGIVVPGAIIAQYIIQGYLDRGLQLTIKRKDVATGIGNAVSDFMKTCTAIIPIVGSGSTSPSAGTRTGTLK